MCFCCSPPPPVTRHPRVYRGVWPTKEQHVYPRWCCRSCVCQYVTFSTFSSESKMNTLWNLSPEEWLKLKPTREGFVQTGKEVEQTDPTVSLVHLKIHCHVQISLLVMGSPGPLGPLCGAEQSGESLLPACNALYTKRQTFLIWVSWQGLDPWVQKGKRPGAHIFRQCTVSLDQLN